MLFLTLFLVGVIFFVAHAVQERQRRLDRLLEILGGAEPNENEQIVYRYLPRDIDDYYRTDLSIPSKMYTDMFSENTDALRIR